MYKLIKHLFIFLLFILPAQLIAMPLIATNLLCKWNDIRILSSNLASQRLWKWLRWADNGDHYDMNFGVNGGMSYQTICLLGNDISQLRHSLIINTVLAVYDPDQEGKIVPKWKIFWMRFNWLALRNPVNYLKIRILGVKSPEFKTIKQKQWNQNTGIIYSTSNLNKIPRISDYEVPGWRTIVLNDNIWEIYLVHRWPILKNKCLRVRLGYKLGHLAEHVTNNDLKRPYLSYVFVIQPFKSFRGITL